MKKGMISKTIVFSLSLFLFFCDSGWAKEEIPFEDIGDGQQALSVILTLVDGIAIDPEGNIYISHRSKNRIRKIDKNGIITTIAGNGKAGFSGDGGPALQASLNFPAGLALFALAMLVMGLSAVFGLYRLGGIP